jgi:hypothetical protein
MNRLLILFLVIFCSCSSANKLKSYYFVEAFKEQEILLQLKDDSTFSFIDKIGCNKFEFRGKYKEAIGSAGNYFIIDSIRLEEIMPNSNSKLIFQINNGDTVWIINNDRLSINHQPFKRMEKANVNLQEIRYKKMKEYYIEFLGKEGFLKIFGNGNEREAKRRLLDCKLPDIILK